MVKNQEIVDDALIWVKGLAFSATYQYLAGAPLRFSPGVITCDVPRRESEGDDDVATLQIVVQLNDGDDEEKATAEADVILTALHGRVTSAGLTKGLIKKTTMQKLASDAMGTPPVFAIEIEIAYMQKQRR